MGTASLWEPKGRDYPQLFRALDDALTALFSALASGKAEDEGLRRSFEAVAAGFGAEKAALLVVEGRAPLRLRALAHRDMTKAEVAAVERGESVPGVSSSKIREAVERGETVLVEDPRHLPSHGRTEALEGRPYSVLCAPVVDPLGGDVLAVLYVQNHGFENALCAADAGWASGYTRALGRALAVLLEVEERRRKLEELLEDRPQGARELVGESEQIRELLRELHEVWIPSADGKPPDPLLILGETGTGKEQVARYIHACSSRKNKPFVALNCASVPAERAESELFGHRKGSFTGADRDEPGAIRAAEGGVVFLDEIGELQPGVQAKLLRTLDNHTVRPVGESQERSVNVYFILATNAPIEEMVRGGRFKHDLYERFKMQRIELAPLRERREDIRPLAHHFLGVFEQRSGKRTAGLTPGAMRVLLAYSWPGNVRELQRLVSNLVLRARPGTYIDVDVIGRVAPAMVQGNLAGATGVSFREAVEAFERELIAASLDEHRGNRQAAAEALGLPLSTLKRYVYDLGIRPRRPRGVGEPDMAGEGDEA